LQWWRHNFKVSVSSSMQILLVLRDKIKWKCQTEILWHTLHFLFEFPFYFLVVLFWYFVVNVTVKIVLWGSFVPLWKYAKRVLGFGLFLY
jgi:hypothetical protein